MAVKTKFSKKDILKILENYNIGSFVSYKGFKSGTVQTNYLIVTSKGKYALRCYDERKLKQVDAEMQFLTSLEKTNIPYTRIIRTMNKKNYVIYSKKAILINSFLEGREKKQNKKEYAKQLGLIVGKIHAISKNIKLKNPRIKEVYDYSFLRSLFKSRKKELGKKLSKSRKRCLETVLEMVKGIDKLKIQKGMNHGDLLHDDILFKNEKLSGVLDFDDCFYGFLLCDLAEVCAFWCINTAKVHFDYIKEAIKSYERSRRLSKSEIENLYYFVLLLLSIHFLYGTYNTKYPRYTYATENFNKIRMLVKLGKDGFDRGLKRG